LAIVAPRSSKGTPASGLPPVRPRQDVARLAEDLRQLSQWAEGWIRLTTNTVRRYRDQGLVNKVEVADLGAIGGALKSKQVLRAGLVRTRAR